MRARLAILTAVGALAALCVPAHAALPGCASYVTRSPYRVAQTGADLVKANFSIWNYCGEEFVVDLKIYRFQLCLLPDCGGDVLVAASTYPVPRASENGFEVSGTCVEGDESYQLRWSVKNSSAAEVAWGGSEWVDLTCDNDVPPVHVCAPLRPQLPICKTS